MKKIVLLLILVSVCIPLLCGCATVPTSKDAKIKMEDAGYTVTLTRFNEAASEDYEEKQIIQLNAEKDDEFFLQAYFFRTKADTDRFFREKQESLRRDVEAFHKFGYVICRGSAEAVADFLK